MIKNSSLSHDSTRGFPLAVSIRVTFYTLTAKGMPTKSGSVGLL